SFATSIDSVTTLCKVGLDPRLAAAINLFPNPTNGQWTLESPIPVTGIRVFDLYGRSVLQQKVQSQRLQFETPEWTPGVYLVQIETTLGTHTRRLMIQK
ncbi:MAG: T9SS type A sorting domain-containing protein, partial [Bacteroidota bacterium]